MSVGLYSHTTRAIGTVLTAAIYNSDHTNHITNQNPVMTGAYSDSVGQYQTNTDPGGVGSESLAGNLAGELERLRFAIKRITGKAQWYVAPAANLDQTLNSVNAGEIAIAGAIPLTLRRTENDATARIVERFSLGSGAGADLELQLKGTGANDVTEAAFLINNIEMVRWPQQAKQLWTPQGYLTPTTGVPIIVADAVAATSIWYEPLYGFLFPFITSAGIYMRTITALELALNNPSHAANSLYDIYIFDDAGTLRIVSSPAWSNSGAGVSARGTGAGTAELVRHATGLLTNAVQQTVRNGANTFTMPVQTGTYLGTFLTAAAGTVTCHRSWGQSRLWGIWNNFNRQPLFLKAGDSTASWNYQTNTIRPSNNAAANSLTVLAGLAEEWFNLEFGQQIGAGPNASSVVTVFNGIGWNSTTVMSGRRGRGGVALSGGAANISAFFNVMAQHFQVPALGINVVTALETADNNTGSASWHGGEDDMILSAIWRG